jgi:preprotein translocase SecE subunit
MASKSKKKQEGFLTKVKIFFKGMKKELKKVRWATKEEFIKYTRATIFFIIFFALFFLLSDVIITGLKQLVR